MNLAHLLARIAAQDPHRSAVLLSDRVLLDYGALAQRCSRLAAGLRATGLAPGDRVALYARNHPAYLELMWGAWWAGLVIVPVNAKLHAKEAAWIVQHSGARLCFVGDGGGDEWPADLRRVQIDSPEHAALFAAEPQDIEARDAADLAWLFYTSGTTGRPKGVMLSHRNLLTMGLAYFSDVDAIAEHDATVYAAPMSHGAGLYAVPHMIAGARHVVPASGGFDAAELFELARSVGRLHLFAAPTMVRRLVEHAERHRLDGEGFKTIVYGGAPMYAADISHALRVMGPRFVQIYGQGESPMTISALSRRHLIETAHARYAQRVASVGVAHTGVELRIVDEQDRPVAPGADGEVLVRGDTVMTGYWRDDDATATTLRGGWLHTGDIGSLDADGFLTLKDRSKDVIISGGSNIYPREVEEVLLLDRAVAEASVIGAPDPEWGEVVVAFVVPREGCEVETARLDALCLAHIARFKRPKQYRVIAALPKSHYGKILKSELRRLLDEARL
jgi:long-chain acyl-CoA synthetase